MAKRKTQSRKWYKVLERGEDWLLHSCNGGTAVWPEPKNGRPGKWLPRIPAHQVNCCVAGYHVVRRNHVGDWLSRSCDRVVCDVEVRGRRDRDRDKSAFQQARILRVVGVVTGDEVLSAGYYAAARNLFRKAARRG